MMKLIAHQRRKRARFRHERYTLEYDRQDTCWSEREIQLFEENVGKVKGKELAEIIGRSLQAIYVYASKRKISLLKKPRG